MLQIKANVRHMNIGTYITMITLFILKENYALLYLRVQNGPQIATRNIKFITFANTKSQKYNSHVKLSIVSAV